MRKVIIIVLLLAVLALLNVNCGEDIIESDSWFNISGTIVDSSTNSPIDSAIVKPNHEASAITRYSDSLGKYTIPGVGSMRVIVKKDGYITQQIDLNITKDTTGVDFYLVK